MVSEADTHSAAQMQPSSLQSEKLFAPLSYVFNSSQANRAALGVHLFPQCVPLRRAKRWQNVSSITAREPTCQIIFCPSWDCSSVLTFD